MVVTDIFDDDDILSEAEIIDYAEYLADNNINPREIERYPEKIEKDKEFALDILFFYWDSFQKEVF